MTKLAGQQLSLIAESEFIDPPVGDWDYDELGTDKSLVPNSPDQKLGTDKSLVPNFPNPKLGTKESLVPNFPDSKLGTNEWTPPDYSNWHPPIGCLDRKWIKNHQYWCWRYYDIEGKKRSIHLHKDYNKAVRKAIKIGVPPDARLPNLSAPDPQGETHTPTTNNILPIAPPAHGASRNSRAA
jgi:hypothetical protein